MHGKLFVNDACLFIVSLCDTFSSMHVMPVSSTIQMSRPDSNKELVGFVCCTYSTVEIQEFSAHTPVRLCAPKEAAYMSPLRVRAGEQLGY